MWPLTSCASGTPIDKLSRLPVTRCGTPIDKLSGLPVTRCGTPIDKLSGLPVTIARLLDCLPRPKFFGKLNRLEIRQYT